MIRQAPLQSKFLSICLFLLLIAGISSAQTSYTWNGSVDTDFATAGNWTPSGVPGSGDDITIVTTSNDPVLDGDRTVNKLTMTSGVLKLAAYDLTVTTTGTFNGGTVENGQLLMTATSGVTTFSGTIMDCEIDIDGKATINANSIFKESVVFTKIASLGASTFEKKADLKFTRYNLSTGGNVFKDTTVINAASVSGYSQYMGSSSPDTFLAPVTFNLLTTMDFYLANSSSGNYFADDVTIHLSANNTSDVFIGNSASSSCLFEGDIILNVDNGSGSINFNLGTNEHDGSLLIGSSGYNNETLTLAAYTQLGSQTIDLSDMGSASDLTLGPDLVVEGDFIGPGVKTTVKADCRFKGDVTLDEVFAWSGSVFDGVTNITMTRYNLSTGGNVFKDTTIINAASSSGYAQYLGGAEPDTFLAPVTFNMNSPTNSDLYICSSSSGNYFADDVFLNCTSTSNSEIIIGNNASAGSHFAGDIIMHVDSGGGNINFKLGSHLHDGELKIGAQGYHSGTLYLYECYEQSAPNDMDLSAMDHNAKLYLGDGLTLEGGLEGPVVHTTLKANCVFNGDVTLPKIETWNGYTTCNAKADLKMTRYNTFVGGNVFRDSTIITAASAQGYTQRIGHLVPDTFLAPVTLQILTNMDFYICNGSSGNYFASNVQIINNGWTSADFYVNATSATFDGDITLATGDYARSIDFLAGDVVHNGILKIDSTGFNNGKLYLRRYVQTATGLIDLTNVSTSSTVYFESTTDITADLLLDGSKVSMVGATFRGDVDVTSASIPVLNCDFHGSASFKKTGGTNNVNGGNIFRGPFSIEKTGSNYISWGHSAVDTFLSDVSASNFASSWEIFLGTGAGCFVGGDLTLEGASKGIILGNTSGTIRVTFNGVGDQLVIINDPGANVNVRSVEVDKPSGRLKLNDGFTVGNFLALTNGIIETSENAVLNLTDGVLPVGSNTSYVDGPLKKTGNDAFTFPVGSNGVYKPITMSAPGSGGDAYSVTYNRRNPNNWVGDDLETGNLSYLTPLEYWEVEQNNGTNNVSWTLEWNVADGYSNFQTSELLVAGWDGTEWDDLGAGTVTGDTDDGTIQTAAAVELDNVEYLSLGASTANMLPQTLAATVSQLVDPTEDTYGIVTIEPDLGVGENTVEINGTTYLSKEGVVEAWEESLIKDSLIVWTGDTINLPDTIQSVWTGQTQNWVRPGIYEVKVRDSSGDTWEKELAFASDEMDFASFSHMRYLNDTLSKDTSVNSWGHGFADLLNFLEPNTNGGFEVEVIDLSSEFALGFRDGEVPAEGGYDHLGFAVVIENSDVHVWYDGSLQEDLTTVAVNDKLRVDRVSGEYRLKKNDNLVHKTSSGGIHGAKHDWPTISIKVPDKFPITGVTPFTFKPKPKFTVEHEACGYPGSGSISVDFGAYITNFPGMEVTWERVGGTDPVHDPQDLEVSGLEAGEYTFQFDCCYGYESPDFTLYVDRWVDWTGHENAASTPQDADLIHTNPYNASATPIISLESGAHSEQTFNTGLDGSGSKSRLTFNTTSVGTGSLIGFTDATESASSDFREIDYAMMTIHLPTIPTLADPLHLFFKDGVIETDPNGWVFRMTPSGVDLHTEWEENSSPTPNRIFFSRGNYVNSATEFYSIDVTDENKDWLIDASPVLGQTGYEDARTTFECNVVLFEDDTPCALLSKTLDGGFHWTIDGKLRFQIDEEYIDGGGTQGSEPTISYRVLDENNEEVVGTSIGTPSPINSELKYYGDNRFQLNLNSVIDQGMYVLEVTSEKNEKFYLRFKKGV